MNRHEKAVNRHELELGIFARVFPPAEPSSVAALIRSHGLRYVQLNLVAVGLPTIPDEHDRPTIDFGRIGEAFERAGLTVWGVSATYNMAHPEPGRRTAETRRAAALVPHVRELGATRMTLCTGTRDADDKWRAHPDNETPEAWSDMMDSFVVLADAALGHGVTLVVEPEPGNVIKGADAALRLVDALGDRSPVLRFIIDPANLVSGVAAAGRSAVLDDAFARLGDRTVCLHAKDVVPWRDRLRGVPGLDFTHIMRLRDALPEPVPVLVQDSTPDQVDQVCDLLRAAHAGR